MIRPDYHMQNLAARMTPIKFPRSTKQPRSNRTVLSIFGTRPETIKMAPVLKELGSIDGLESRVCVTGQHRDLLDQALGLFGLETDYDLEIMRQNQSLFDTTIQALDGLREVILDAKPDMVLVHGDTTTTLAAALAAFYLKIPVGHVEAGLRSFNKNSPWPEEFNRKTVSSIADLHFAPTARSRHNLIAENVPHEAITVTGNTVIDAVRLIAARRDDFPMLRQKFKDRPLVLVTAHRRENFGKPFERIFETLRQYALQHPHVHLIYPVHPNPSVSRPAREKLADLQNVSLIPPVDYTQMVFLLQHCHFVLTDSGGLQEEAPTFGKPVVVLRETTERPEAIEAGTAVLVGSDPEKIRMVLEALTDPMSATYRRMAQAHNPFGDGRAAERIAWTLRNALVTGVPVATNGRTC